MLSCLDPHIIIVFFIIDAIDMTIMIIMKKTSDNSGSDDDNQISNVKSFYSILKIMVRKKNENKTTR